MPSKTVTRRVLGVAFAGALALGGAACGDDDDTQIDDELEQEVDEGTDDISGELDDGADLDPDSEDDGEADPPTEGEDG